MRNMKRRYYKLIDKKMQWIKIKTLIILFLSFFCVHFAFCTDYAYTWLYEIKFNYESGHSNDALDIKKNNDCDIPVPEWRWLFRSENLAYIKGQNNRKIRVRFDSNCDSMHLLINVNIVSGNGIGEVCNFFVENYYKLDTITLTLEGSVPNSVGKNTFSWEWEIYTIPKDPAYCSYLSSSFYAYSHTYYTLLAAPQAPVAEPWTDVLDLACTWASNNTSESQAIADITTNAYNHFEQTKHYSGWSSHAGGTAFNLTGFFNDDWGDCRDMSAVVQVFTWMLGGTVTKVLTINDKNPYVENFCYNSIKPFGQGWTQGINCWNFHQVGWYNNVYDACIKVNYNNPRIPVNENINESYKTDLYYSGDWEPKIPFYFTTVY